MSLASVRSLLTSWLASNVGSLPLSYENFPFDPPEHSPWAEVKFMGGVAQNATFGDGRYRIRGLVQVLLMYPENVGAGPATQKADEICALFPRGLTIGSGALRVLIPSPPYVSNAYNGGGWYQVPVSIPFLADIGP